MSDAGPEPYQSPPIEELPVVMCRVCGFANVPGISLCARPSCRKMLPRNRLAITNALYAVVHSPEMQSIENAGAALVQQSIEDAGGRQELGARELSDHQYRGLLHVRIMKLSLALDSQGDFDKRGRLRKGWIELLERLIASAVSIDKQLGLKRQPRHVDPMEGVRLAVAEANRLREGDSLPGGKL